MSAGGWVMAVVLVLTVAALVFLVWSMVRSIQNNRTGERSVMREFGLGILLMVLFFASWLGQAVVQWQEFTDEAAAHGESVKVGDFMASFMQSTLENWQSEF